MECIFPKKEDEEVGKDWLEERRNTRKDDARLRTILDELECYYQYEDCKKRLKALFEFHEL